MQDPRTRFSATVDAYERYRPSYPAGLVDWILEESGVPPKGRVADVGCGTGISARLFAERGLEVVGIDPNEEMLDRARQAGGARFLRGDAAATGLETGAFDLVTSGQAFHWFPTEPTLAEFSRILKPGGSCAVFWNTRTSTPFMRAYDGVLSSLSTEYGEIPKPRESARSIGASARVRNLVERTFPHVQVLDREGLLGRAHSSSYVVHGVLDKPAFDDALTALFHRHQVGGRVEFTYASLVLLFGLAPG
ncbi:MAG TPA: methyltransferase domain-containing protein [Vicinamibacteria bacterium]|nr:methyltransferase domain-containing protein [Vicinamibacteria bacterium]